MLTLQEIIIYIYIYIYIYIGIYSGIKIYKRNIPHLVDIPPAEDMLKITDSFH